MSIEVKVPDLGDGIDSGDVLEVLVREGDVIQKDQGIIELETDKATVEVPSSHGGKVARVHVAAGQSVAPGDVLLTLESTPAAASPAAPAKPAASSTPAAPAKQGGPPAAKPAPASPPAERPQRPDRPAAPPAPSPPPAAPRAKSLPAKSAPPPEAAVAAEPPAAAGGVKGGAVAAGPAVRRFAREVGVDLQHVVGSGPGGRITREDVLETVRRAGQGSKEAAPAAARGPGEASSDKWGPIRVERMSKIRRTIAEHMHRSWESCPRVTNFDDADVSELERIRVSSKADYAAAGIKLTSLPFVVKAVAMALRQHPVLNASIDVENEQIIYKDYVSIGVAVDTDRGLIVPALRGADRLSIPEVARQLAGMAEKVRTGEFTIDDLRGSTFTISNLGAIGGTYATPIINAPEVAILLVGRSRKIPVVLENDQLAARLMMPLSLAYDHRLVDGAAAARFLNDVIGYLEAPSRLLLAPSRPIPALSSRSRRGQRSQSPPLATVAVRHRSDDAAAVARSHSDG